jgi:hypothetical protein
MAFVPELPGISATSYGQGFGNWQKYAGFDAKNPFGNMPARQAIIPTGAAPVPVPVEDAAPVAMQPTVPMGQYGAQPQGSFGSTQDGQYGSLHDAVRADEIKY